MIHTPCIQPIYQYSTSLGNREINTVYWFEEFFKEIDRRI